MKNLFIITLLLLSITPKAFADEAQATVYLLTTDGLGAEVGTISFRDTPKGLLVKEEFANLPAGAHGIHIHENGNCGITEVDGKITLGGAAGGHYDPDRTGQHKGPNSNGHKGDLPVLTVAPNGTATAMFYLKNLTTAEIKSRSVIIHAGADNYKDTPTPLGGGGDRIACGVIK